MHLVGQPKLIVELTSMDHQLIIGTHQVNLQTRFTCFTVEVPKAESLFHGISDTLPLEQLPQVRQMWYCLCDVRLPIAEQILKRNCFVQGNRADEQNGWLPPVDFYTTFHSTLNFILLCKILGRLS